MSNTTGAHLSAVQHELNLVVNRIQAWLLKHVDHATLKAVKGEDGKGVKGISEPSFYVGLKCLQCDDVLVMVMDK